MRAAFFSGGKESLYVIYTAVRDGIAPDILIHTIYDFPRPSPHTLNLGLVGEISSSIGIPMVLIRADRGEEKEQIATTLKKFDVKRVLAGDVYVEEHRIWLEDLCKIAGSECLEPLWGRNTEELFREIFSLGFSALIVGLDPKYVDSSWLGRTISKNNAEVFLRHSHERGFDPCGERGEYHTLVVRSPLHRWGIRVTDFEERKENGYLTLKVTSFERAKYW